MSGFSYQAVAQALRLPAASDGHPRPLPSALSRRHAAGRITSKHVSLSLRIERRPPRSIVRAQANIVVAAVSGRLEGTPVE